MTTLEEDQDRRRTALVERLGTVADLACAAPFPGKLGDVAYDLLRQAAAQIASDRLRIRRLAATGAGESVEAMRERCAKVADSNRTDDGSMWDRAAATIASEIRDPSFTNQGRQS